VESSAWALRIILFSPLYDLTDFNDLSMRGWIKVLQVGNSNSGLLKIALDIIYLTILPARALMLEQCCRRSLRFSADEHMNLE
jgi:hypothetical protein